MALSTDIAVKLTGTLTTSADGQSDTQRRFVEVLATLTNGTGSGAADKVYHSAARTLGASGTEDLDLAGGLTDPAGNAVTFAKIKAIIFKNKGAGTITVSRPSSNGVPLFAAASDALAPIASGGGFLFYDPSGVTVTASTGDLITVTADGSGAVYQVIIIGTSA